MYSLQLAAYPSSWYCVAFSDELAPGSVLTRRVAGQEVVLFRGESGLLGAVDAHCPHLGAHFAHGGRVEGEKLRCPFHGFCFDRNGACVETGYGTRPPPRARLGTWPVLERHGIVFVHFHPEGRPPHWEIPDVDTSGWTPIRRHSMRLRSHVQEIAENSVDIGHFTWIHGYENVSPLAPLSTDGPYLRARYAIRRTRKTFGLRQGVEAQFEIHQHGLGYARVEVEIPSLGIRTRQFVLARPLSEDEIELTIGMSVLRVAQPARIHPLLALAPRRWLTERIAAAAFKEFVSDVAQDLPIWNNKVYVSPPALAQGDGPVGLYRKWARQFSQPPAALAAAKPPVAA